MSRLNSDIQTVQNFIMNDFLTIFIQFISFIAAAAYMLIIKWDLFVLSIIVAPLCLVLLHIRQKNQKDNSKKSYEYLGKAATVARDAISGIYISKAFNLGNFLLDRYRYNVNKALEYNIANAGLMLWNPPVQTMLKIGTRVICVIYGAYLSLKGLITPGDLLAFLYLMGFIVWPLTYLIDYISGIKISMGAAERIVEVLEEKPERKDGRSFVNYTGDAIIRFKNLSFSYIEGTPVLNNLNFEIRRGKTVALVGQSGCGKSTVLKLICGFIEPCDGRIEIYEKNSGEWNLSSLRSQIALVSQDAFLYPASVYENISYGKPGATRAEILNAAAASYAAEFIPSLPEGYDTFIGEQGIKLSGGQRQRIALARAFLKDAPIVLFDEPTSALDTYTERMVQAAIAGLMKNKTVLIVAHRSSTIKDADEIMVMDRGEIAEKGRHEELIKSNGKYNDLYIKRYFDDEEVDNCLKE